VVQSGLLPGLLLRHAQTRRLRTEGRLSRSYRADFTLHLKQPPSELDGALLAHVSRRELAHQRRAHGGRGGTRTPNHPIQSRAFYLLNYAPLRLGEDQAISNLVEKVEVCGYCGHKDSPLPEERLYLIVESDRLFLCLIAPLSIVRLTACEP
jgi:hypothetical protein